MAPGSSSAPLDATEHRSSTTRDRRFRRPRWFRHRRAHSPAWRCRVGRLPDDESSSLRAIACRQWTPGVTEDRHSHRERESRAHHRARGRSRRRAATAGPARVFRQGPRLRPELRGRSRTLADRSHARERAEPTPFRRAGSLRARARGADLRRSGTDRRLHPPSARDRQPRRAGATTLQDRKAAGR